MICYHFQYRFTRGYMKDKPSFIRSEETTGWRTKKKESQKDSGLLVIVLLLCCDSFTMHVDSNKVRKISSPTRARTGDLQITSLALSQLSYQAGLDIFPCPIIIYVSIYIVYMLSLRCSRGGVETFSDILGYTNLVFLILFPHCIILSLNPDTLKL